MENMNNFYNFEVSENEIKIIRKANKDDISAFFNFTDKGGMVAKDMLTGIEYKSFKRWIKGLMIHREIDLSKAIDINKFN